MTKHSAPLKLPRRFIPFFQLFFLPFFLWAHRNFDVSHTCVVCHKWKMVGRQKCHLWKLCRTSNPPTNCLCTTYYCVGKCLFRQSAKSEICVLCVSLSLLSLLLLLLYLFSFSILSVVVVQLAYMPHHTTDQIRLYQKQHMEKQTDQSHTHNTQTQGQSLSPQ